MKILHYLGIDFDAMDFFWRICRKIKVLFVILVIFPLFSCSSENVSLQKKYGNDAFYFLGLQNLENGNKKEALRFFSKGVRQGGLYTARLSAEELTKIGTVQEKLAACENLVDKYDDEKALLLYAKNMSEQKEFSYIIQKTENVDLEKSSNSLIALRLYAMAARQDSRLEESIYRWCISRNFSQEHLDFFRKGQGSITDSDIEEIIKFRVMVFLRNYKEAYSLLEKILLIIQKNEKLLLEKMLISDFGKVCLFGSQNWLENAAFFEKLARQMKDAGNSECEYYACFYAGRLYDKAGGFYTRSAVNFERAMECSASDFQFDNALWYLLNLNLGISTDRAIKVLEKYSGQWHDCEYFSDFLDTMSVLLFSAHKWNDFYRVFKIIEDSAENRVCAKYAYLSARLMEEGLAENSTEEIKQLFLKTVDFNDSYYKILAMRALKLPSQDVAQKMLFTKPKKKFVRDEEAEKILRGFADFGFPQRMYGFWEVLYAEKIPLSQEILKDTAYFMAKCPEQIENNMYKSIRIASIAANESEKPVSVELLKLAYPQNYYNLVAQASAEFGLEEKIMYALIRSESFFNPEIKSLAGAVGLTQLMNATAGDVAKKLKVKEFDLADPAVNIRFGAYYLSSLIQRLDDNSLVAAFAYNGGITRVRRWISNSCKELGFAKNELPMDLFLETVPFEETREYGRKIVSASAMYGWLYYDISPVETAQKLLKN